MGPLKKNNKKKNSPSSIANSEQSGIILVKAKVGRDGEQKWVDPTPPSTEPPGLPQLQREDHAGGQWDPHPQRRGRFSVKLMELKFLRGSFSGLVPNFIYYFVSVL